MAGLPSRAFALPSGGTAYALNAALYNESPHKMLSPSFISFECPKWEFEITLLPDPRCKIPREGPHYVLDPRETPYERETVLNHLIGRRRWFAPGEIVEGWLLAVGRLAIPLRYRKDDQFRFRIRLNLYDQKGRPQQALFCVSVEKSREHKRLMERIAAEGKTRRKLIPDEDTEKAHQDEPPNVVSVIQEKTPDATD
jgi:hypothetical protein